MTVDQVQDAMSSLDFSEWIAFYMLEAELSSGDHTPDADELGDKLSAWAAVHNAGTHGKVMRERR